MSSKVEVLAMRLPILGLASSVLLPLSMAAIFLYAPTERVQGNVQRIFYLHLPLAWIAYLSFFIVFVGSVLYLWRRADRWDHLAHAAAEVGVVFTTLVLITGSIWARPIWGTWWSWDARLTTTLVLWFIYVGYLMLRSYVVEERRAARYAAVLGIVGFLDVPIIHQSVTWWRTLHPEPVVLAPGGPAMPPSMLLTFGLSMVAFTVFFAWLLQQRYQLEQTRQSIRVLREREFDLASAR
jgi:heme exporter protein C